MLNFQKIRSLLFYLSVIIFFTGLPFIISFALGYKFSAQNLKFIKTGLIYVKTQPEGARIFINGKLFPEHTPASIYELTPGVYKITLELEEYYPWKAEIDVEAGKALRLDKVILFPLRPALEQLNQEKFSDFRLDTERRLIYYLDLENNIVYKSNLDGGNFEDIASLPDKITPLGWEISPDKKKMFIFSSRQINIIFLDTDSELDNSDSPISLDYSREKINNVFWHSDSYHLIVLTNRYVQVTESRQSALAVNLVKLAKEDSAGIYDPKEDALYFSDAQRGSDGFFYDNLYKLKLETDLYRLGIIRKKSDE